MRRGREERVGGDVGEILPETGELRHSEKLLDGHVTSEKHIIPN